MFGERVYVNEYFKGEDDTGKNGHDKTPGNFETLGDIHSVAGVQDVFLAVAFPFRAPENLGVDAEDCSIGADDSYILLLGLNGPAAHGDHFEHVDGLVDLIHAGRMHRAHDVNLVREIFFDGNRDDRAVDVRGQLTLHDFDQLRAGERRDIDFADHRVIDLAVGTDLVADGKLGMFHNIDADDVSALQNVFIGLSVTEGKGT